MHNKPKRGEERIAEVLRQRVEDLRIEATAKDGRKHSYSLEEYGNSTHGLEPQIRSVWGMTILSVVMVAMTLAGIPIFLSTLDHPDGPVWGALVSVVVLAPFTWVGVDATIREARAKRLRKQRGIPDPIK